MTNLRHLSDLSEFKEETSLAKELPYWDIFDDIVVLADGTLATALKLDGMSIETWDEDEINRLTIDVRSFLNGLSDDTEISFFYDVNSGYDALITEHESLKGDLPQAMILADERIRRFREESQDGRLLKSSIKAIIYLRKTAGDDSKKKNLLLRFFEKPKKFQSITKEEFERKTAKIHELTRNIEGVLSGVGFKVTKIAPAEIIEMIYQFLNPKRSRLLSAPKIREDHREQEFLPSELSIEPHLSLPSPREQLCFSDLILDEDYFRLGSVYHRVITLKALPEFTHAGLSAKLTGLSFHHSILVHIKVPPQTEELSRLQARRRMAHSMSLSHGGRATDLESEAKLHATEDLLRELLSTGQKIFYVQMSILIRSENVQDLNSMTNAVLSKVRELGSAEGLLEEAALFKTWKTMLPFGNLTTIRPKRMKTETLSDLIPIYEGFQGVKEARPICLFQNRLGGLVQYDPFHPGLPNYNALVTGSSGAGKSFTNNLILFQYMTQRPQVFIIDIGGSYRKLAEYFGGQYIDIAPPKAGEAIRPINPFSLPPGTMEPSPQKLKFLLSFLEVILSGDDDGGGRLGKLQRALLEEAVIKTYADHIADSHEPKLSDLSNLLQKSEDATLRSFSKMLYPWTEDRPYGRLLDQESSLDVTSDLAVFDLKGLSAYPDLQGAMILIITDFILGRIEAKDPTGSQRKKQILMDECWSMLQSRGASSFMEYCVRTLRKSGSGITFITQGLEEIIQSPIGPAILANTATKFILLQRGDLEPSRKILKLNKEETRLVSSLRQVKGEYSEGFLMANDVRGVVRFVPTPFEYWLATSDANDNSYLEELRGENQGLSLIDVITLASKEYPFGRGGAKLRGVRSK